MRRAEPLRSERLYAVSGRFFLISIGLFSVCWAIITFPVFWSDARLDYTADRILDGETFKREVLQILLADASSAERTWPRPEALRSAAIIRLQLAEQSNKAEGPTPLDPTVDQLGMAESIRRSLSASPADSFLWLALFRLERMKGDHSKEDFAYLRMSYLVGPHEGWVAVDRNHIALAIFPELPQDLAEMSVTEFKDLVASAYYDAAVHILVGPGSPIRDMLLRRLEDAPVEARRQFAQSADQLGYNDIAVPGVERPDPRPWR
jgi:hypothetical protein